MKRIAFAALGAALFGLAFAVSPVFAEDDDKGGDKGKHWYFNVENTSNGTVLEFRTKENDEWSENWLGNRLEPGDKVKLDFETDKGDCEVRTQIHMADGTYFDAPVDYCKASTLEVQDKTLIWK